MRIIKKVKYITYEGADDKESTYMPYASEEKRFKKDCMALIGRVIIGELDWMRCVSVTLAFKPQIGKFNDECVIDRVVDIPKPENISLKNNEPVVFNNFLDSVSSCVDDLWDDKLKHFFLVNGGDTLAIILNDSAIKATLTENNLQ